MRRIVGMSAGLLAVLALAGGGTVAAAPPGPAAPAPAERAAAAPAGTGAAERPASVAPRPAAAAGRAAAAGPASAAAAAPAVPPAVPRAGRQRIGTVENVQRRLSYADPSDRAVFRYPGASYVKVHLSRALLLPGDEVTVADPAGTEVHRYRADALGAVAELARGGRWAMSVPGDTAVVRLRRTLDPLGLRRALDRSGADLARHGVTVDRVAHGLTPGERAARRAGPGGPGREESICGADNKADAVCYRTSDPVAYRHSKAVVRLLIDGTELCTGWRVGPDNRLLTNNHCFARSEEAYNTEVWFNYQCARCRGFEVFRPTKVWGDRVLYTDRTLDLTVFTVENFAEIRGFGHLELDPVRPVRGDQVYIPQHPAGEPTVIAMASDVDRAGNCAVVDPAYDGYGVDTDVSYYCDTEGGSSGSPVLSRRTGRVVALHHFGGCPNSGVRADLIHQRIQHLLG
ncbi:MAG TPA: serine protease [Pilimelia sp.]|nr:serine protease [Pilimelia sp.]